MSWCDKITDRIYLNVHPDHAPEVIGFAAGELLKPDHGVMDVKVATPPGLVNRADAIVIYASLLTDVDWALGLLAQYQEDHRDHFLKDLPAATRPRLRCQHRRATRGAGKFRSLSGQHRRCCAE